MESPRRIEREFGVPFPGEILPQDQWTRTGLKRLPDTGRLSWPELFGREAPVVLDLGCGNGRFSVLSAVLRPDHDHLGLDQLPVVIRYATRRANQRGLANIRFAVGDSREFLQRLVDPRSAAEIHVYHPQPYHDPADVGRRLLAPRFLALVHRALAVGGQFFVQTDNADYWRAMSETIPHFFVFSERQQPWADAPKGRTRREIIALKRGLPVFRGQGTARGDLDETAALELAERLERHKR